MLKLKPRAEDYTLDELLQLKTYNYFSMWGWSGKKLLVIGDRGDGKTFSIRHEIASRIDRGDRVKPCFYIFKKNKVLETIDYPYTSDCDLFVYDDIHYLCESVLRGETRIDVLINLFREICENKHKVILISDSPLCVYADQLKNDDFYQLIMNFGEYSPSKRYSYDEYINIKKNVDTSARREFSRMGDSGLMSIAEGTGRKIDSKILLYFLKGKLNPREIVNFINLFDGDIACEKVIEHPVVKKKEKKILYDGVIVCDKPEMFTIFKLAKIFRTYRDFRDYITNFDYIIENVLFNTFEQDFCRVKKLHPEYFKKFVNHKYKYMKILIKGTKRDHWEFAQMYYKRLRTWQKNKIYSGDMGIFTGWKGTFVNERDELAKIDVSAKEQYWRSNVKFDCTDDCRETCPFPTLKKIYEPLYRDKQHMKDLKIAMFYGRYSYEKKLIK